MTDRGFVLLIMAAAALALVFRLDHPAFWGDEEISRLFAREGWYDLLITHWSTDTHRPVYYALLKAWGGIWGEGRITERSLNVLISVLCLPVLFAFVKTVAGRRAAVFTLVATPLSPLFVHHARELRMYPLLLLMALCVLWAVAKILIQAPAQSPPWRSAPLALWGAAILSGAGAFYAQAVGLLIFPLVGLGALALAALRLVPGYVVWQGAVALGLFGLLSVPGLWPMVFHMGSTLNDFWLPAPDFSYNYSQFAGLYPYVFWAKPLVGMAFVWGAWCLRRHPVGFVLCLVAALDFPLLLWGISFYKPVLIVRAMAWTSILGGAVIAIGLARLPQRVGALALAGFVALQFAAIQPNYPPQRQPSQIDAFAPYWTGFNPEKDLLILGMQSLEAPLRNAQPQLFAGGVLALNYRDHQAPFSAIYRAEFIRRDQVAALELAEGGRLWVLREIHPLHPIATEDQVAPALGRMVQGLALASEWTSGRLALQIYQGPPS